MKPILFRRCQIRLSDFRCTCPSCTAPAQNQRPTKDEVLISAAIEVVVDKLNQGWVVTNISDSEGYCGLTLSPVTQPAPQFIPLPRLGSTKGRLMSEDLMPGTISVIDHPDLGPVLSTSPSGSPLFLGERGVRAYFVHAALSLLETYLISRISKRSVAGIV